REREHCQDALQPRVRQAWRPPPYGGCATQQGTRPAAVTAGNRVLLPYEILRFTAKSCERMTRGDGEIVQVEDIRERFGVQRNSERPALRRVVMKNDVLKYGLVSGLFVAIMGAATVPFEHRLHISKSL